MQYKSILKTLRFWSNAPIKDISKSVMLIAIFKELTNEPVNLVNKIYHFLGIKMGAEYKHDLMGEAQKAKRYKSEHRYSSTSFDLDSFNSRLKSQTATNLFKNNQLTRQIKETFICFDNI